MKAAWVGEILSRNNFEARPMKLHDLLIARSKTKDEPVAADELERKFFRWLDYEERARAQ